MAHLRFADLTCDPTLHQANAAQIFLYGGSVVPGLSLQDDQASNIALAEVYILSLPSFHWQKTELNPSESRNRQTCERMGSRMIVVGGVTAGLKYADLKTDSWAQGLGVFDLTDLEWKASYDASGRTYQTPQVVKDYVATNGQYPSTWDSNVVEGWFTNKGAFLFCLEIPKSAHIYRSCG